ncbi:MAG: rhomboid family intramembrane serine protease [Planctomycetota bacterium]
MTPTPFVSTALTASASTVIVESDKNYLKSVVIEKMAAMKLEVKKNLVHALAFVGLIWLIFLVSLPLKLTEYDLLKYGLVPRSLSGLPGIITMPFLHDGIDHLLGNTVPMAVLLFILAISRQKPWRIVLGLTLSSGILVWLLGWSSPVVGASGLIYAITLYLIAAGLMERKPGSVVAAVMVGVLYGGTLFWRLLPTAGSKVAWDAHLLAAIAGACFAWQTLREKKPATNKSEPDKHTESLSETT